MALILDKLTDSYGPAQGAVAVTPDDAEPIVSSGQATKGVYVGSGVGDDPTQPGDVVVRLMGSDADVTFENVPAGATLNIRATHVRATGTTATSLIALF